MTIPSYDELIHELSGLCGIIPEYFDIFGKRHAASTETKRAILKAMNLEIDTAEDIVEEIRERRSRRWKTLIEPVRVLSVHEQPLTIPVHLPLREGEEKRLSLVWSLSDAHGRRDEFVLSGEEIIISEQEWIDDNRLVRIDLVDNTKREIGYYTLAVESGHPIPLLSERDAPLRGTARIIIAPDACYLPSELRQGRTWGLSVNLYALRSGRDWGIGDFTDLKGIVQWIAGLGGGFVGINPLHAIPNRRPFGISPYSPISRLYKNFVYLDLEKIPEVAELGAMIGSEVLQRELEGLRKGDLVDYEKVASLKGDLLKKLFEVFYENHYRGNTSRGRAFKDYVAEEGSDLESFATFMVLASEQGKDGTEKEEEERAGPSLLNWLDWPQEYRNPSGEAVQKFRKRKRKEILFFKYVQWLIDEQMEEIAEKIKDSSMAIGLYHDLAIGSVGGGSDAWNYQDVFAADIDLGAPPDDFNLNGQNWGFPPLIPERLREGGYELFIQTIRKNMKHCGALRVDHALGMFRLFWIPGGMHAKEGAYVTSLSEDLLRIIALESVLNKTMVIAEDLGTMGENVRETLKRFQMLSYRLFYFERNYPDPSFLPPDKYPVMALASVTTHDLPTLYGYWEGRDIEVKKALGFYRDDAQWQEQVRERERDRGLILSCLKSQGIIKKDSKLQEILRCPSTPFSAVEMTPELCLAVYEYLALTPSKLVLVSFDDIIGTIDQQNLPGTVEGHPNWMQKTPCLLEEIFSDSRFLSLAEMFRNTLVRREDD
ncbi:MAG TPA: 4-alpha-glucanotransferase [Thermodesulfovibrionales bacterium]|nr:4-alpha-glucanotransferase [Thermodesulfovibrionales bacterium]